MTSPTTPSAPGEASFRGVRARDVMDYANLADHPEALGAGGFWVIAATFEGQLHAWRMATVTTTDGVAEPAYGGAWNGPHPDQWRSSLDETQYKDGVSRIREDIRDGSVYQVNLCRILTAPLAATPDAIALSHRLAKGNPARYAARISIDKTQQWPGQWIVSASPELFLAVDGDLVTSSPIKGTAAPGEPMLDKDVAENVMITDLVRNDISHVAVPGTVRVPELLGSHDHPGLVHLQSTVSAQLAPDFAWTEQMWGALFGGTFPPGSVSGAPKSSALRIIGREEPVPRGPYCGGIGWIDADAKRAELAVGIRTFWWTPDNGGVLHFGTGAGITWGSDPHGEWVETELKARRLIGLASTDTMAP